MNQSGTLMLPSGLTVREFSDVVSLVANSAWEESKKIRDEVSLFIHNNGIHIGTPESVRKIEEKFGPKIFIEQEAVAIKASENSLLIIENIIRVVEDREYEDDDKGA